MKTEESVDVEHNNPTSAVAIWGNSVELSHLATEECLPVIGSSQVSSILSTLDNHDKIVSTNIEIVPPMELIVLQNPVISEPNEQNAHKNQIKKQKHKDLSYILCDLCPFLCLNEKKIAEHIELVHKNKKPSDVFEMKCPACPNIFYHKLSLQSHLQFDHCVTNNNDIAKIIQITLHTKKSSVYSNKLPDVLDINKMPIMIEGIENVEVPNRPSIHCKTENEEDNTADNTDATESVNLPTLDISENNAEKIYNSYIKRPSGISKFLDDTKMHRCTVNNCKVRMVKMEKLNYHIQCHNELMFVCPECHKVFSSWKALSGHLWRSYKIDMELYRCDKCEYRTASLSSLNNTHKLIHGSVKSFTCETCQKSFKNAKQLRNHRDIHRKGDSASYPCKMCSKTFSSNHQLKTHMDGVHKKLKPYLCNYCGYKGATRGGLKMHVRQHTGEKPFSCDQCEYSTADHNSLRRHKLGHSGEKPYKCSHCDYQCIQTSTYKVHIKTKHPGLDKELLFSCSICQFRSVNKDVYNLHMTSQHPEVRAE